MVNAQQYQPFTLELLSLLSANLSKYGLKYNMPLLRGALFTNDENLAVAIDHKICDASWPFHYSLYTEEQNKLMSEYNLFRFVADTSEEIETLHDALGKYINRYYEEKDFIPINITDRHISAIDPTMPEAYFEQAFIDVYGREMINRITREYPIIDIEGKNRFIDYYISHKYNNIAIEKNGETYHHPLIIGKERYLDQLLKQNSIVAYGDKVYRWSLESMRFKDKFQDELKKYLGLADDFYITQKTSISRNFALYRHQEDTLKTIKSGREQGNKASLIVLPTGTGKTDILIADYADIYKQKNGNVKALALVPTLNLKYQLISAFTNRLKEHNIAVSNDWVGDQPSSNLLVQTYSWMARHYNQFDINHFDYIAIDEAHHSVAPVLQKVIHHYNPEFMLGLTATDKRLDASKLENVFGQYEVDLSLVDAIKQGLLSPIKAFRLKSNVDLSEVRYNGRDYVNADLERTITVPSRNQLIIDTLKDYFVDSSLDKKSGLIFCVSIKHAEQIAKMLQNEGISASSVSGKDATSQEKIRMYQDGEIQFLATCSLLTEGWDSPRTSVIVMARPTMSKVLYTQQLGRGTRKYPGKEALYVVDVVDNYGCLGNLSNTPWSIHSLLNYPSYIPWADILHPGAIIGNEELILLNIHETVRSIEEIDIFTFENKYPDYLTDEILARELYVSTETVKNWVKKGLVKPSVTVPFGTKSLNYYEPGQVEIIRTSMNLKVHNEETLYEDFFDFLDERSYTFSYKILMLLSFIKIMDENGECNLDDLASEYALFYQDRLKEKLSVDRKNCPIDETNLADINYIKTNLLTNPFEKLERKRFLMHCKDLNRISFTCSLWARLNKTDDINKIKTQLFADLINYYKPLQGIPNISFWKDYWNISEIDQDIEREPKLIVYDTIPEDADTAEYIPYFNITAAAGSFGMDSNLSEYYSGFFHLPNERNPKDLFIIKIIGKSMEPLIPDNSYALFRAGYALVGSRQGRIVLVQKDDITDLDTGYSLTVKRYQSEKTYDESGSFTHTKIILQPLNVDYSPIVIEEADEQTFKVIGEFVRVLSE